MVRRARSPLSTDAVLRQMLAQRNDRMRQALCTLARLGVAFRRAEASRARAWADELSVHPFYKGGQFLFDLLEWEDFMLDGPAPIVLDAAELAEALRPLLGLLGQAVPPLPAFGDTLPPLEAGFYLYRDVVLGLVWLGLAGVAAGAR
jgi:hypothetical protein